MDHPPVRCRPTRRSRRDRSRSALRIAIVGWLIGTGLVLAGGIRAAAASPPTDPPPPNVVWIIADDLGWADVGFNGGQDIPTPGIDRIAAEGVRCTNGYVTAAVCGPSRAGLITGRYQHRFGASINPTIDPAVPNGPPPEEATIAERLAAAGYLTMGVGKWHLGTHAGLHPRDRGFDHWFGFLSGGHDYRPDTLVLDGLQDVTTKWGWYRTRLLDDGEPVTIDRYLTDALSDRAVSFVGRAAAAGDPFMLYVSYNAPHTPMQATDDRLARFADIEPPRRRRYAAMVSAMDDGVGRILDALDEHGLTANTMVFFISDNGGATNNASRNTPLRGFKGDAWEGGLRVPMAIRWPGVVAAGTDDDRPMSTMDLTATAVAAAGPAALAAGDPSRPLDGVDLRPHLTGAVSGPPRERLFWHSPGRQHLVVRDGQWKLILFRGDEPSVHLHDLAADPSEATNLADDPDQAGRVAELTAAAEAWTAQMMPPAYPGLGAWDPATRPWRPSSPSPSPSPPPTAAPAP